MRVLVIGGNGFIGSHVVDVLLQQGVDVMVFDRKFERFRSPLPGVTYVTSHLGDISALGNAMSQGVDGVVHLASTTIPQSSVEDPVADLQNLVDTLGLLKVCVKHKISKIVFASSGGTVYGIPQTLPITENHPTNPISSYGIVKLSIEKYLQCYDYLYGLPYVILRISNPYGSRQPPDSSQGIISVFTNRIIQGKPVTVWGDGSVVRDFVNVRDIARLCFLALSSDITGVFNAGSGTGIDINELVNLISLELGHTPQILREPPRKFDVPAVILDCNKARRMYSWWPQVTLKEGLKEVGQWLESAGTRTMARSSVN